jgi:hypothetical protein
MMPLNFNDADPQLHATDKNFQQKAAEEAQLLVANAADGLEKERSAVKAAINEDIRGSQAYAIKRVDDWVDVFEAFPTYLAQKFKEGKIALKTSTENPLTSKMIDDYNKTEAEYLQQLQKISVAYIKIDELYGKLGMVATGTLHTAKDFGAIAEMAEGGFPNNRALNDEWDKLYCLAAKMRGQLILDDESKTFVHNAMVVMELRKRPDAEAFPEATVARKLASALGDIAERIVQQQERS